MIKKIQFTHSDKYPEPSYEQIKNDILHAIKFLKEQDNRSEVAKREWEKLSEEQKNYLKITYGHIFNFDKIIDIPDFYVGKYSSSLNAYLIGFPMKKENKVIFPLI